MRVALLVAWCVTVTVAHADRKIVDMTPGFERETEGCQTQLRGLTKLASGGGALAKTLQGAEREAVDADLAAVNQGLALVTEYCAELAAMVELLKANAGAPYRSAERAIDERDAKVRKLRKEAKQLAETMQPIARRLIPRIARLGTPEPPAGAPVPPEPAPVPAPVPRKVLELPELPGSWKLSGSTVTDTAEYSDRGKSITATITARTTAQSCWQYRRALVGYGAQLQAFKPAASEVKLVWSARYRRGGHLIGVLCTARKPGALVATLDLAPATETALAAELATVMARMLALQP
jgi:hypothetical protein